MVVYRFQTVKKMIIKNRYPFPRINDLFDQFRGENIFSKTYFRYGYPKVRIKENDIYKTTFRTRYGHYKFFVIPFGLTKTPATFMCLMNNILSK